MTREEANKLKEDIKNISDNPLFNIISKDAILYIVLEKIDRLTESKDCRNCKKWNECPCGKEGHENGTSIGYSIGECKDYELSEDAVSREAMLSLQTEYAEKMDATTFWELRDDIRALPSVTPRTNLAETSQDCISRTELIQKLNAWDSKAHGIPNYAWKVIREMPSVTPERPKGKWIYTPKRRLIDETDEGCVYMTDYRCTCSECGGDFGFQKMSDAYCKYCGAKMVELRESEDAK